MSVRLFRAGLPVDSVFGLHGRDENDLSAALAFALTAAPQFLAAVVEDLTPGLAADLASGAVHIQTGRQDSGITDVEFRVGREVLIVLEAKKGFSYPSLDQLSRYADVCHRSGCPHTLLVALTSLEPRLVPVPAEWHHLPVPVVARSWKWVRRLARTAHSHERTLFAKRILHELVAFLEAFLGLERAYSNLVYVVSLAADSPPGWATSWIDIVETHGRYFYPFNSKGWPAPPNYLGFRYRGQLQSVHHVDGFDVVDDVRSHFPGADAGPDWGPHYLFKLGAPVRPTGIVKGGPRVFRSARVWCMLDTLLTSGSVSAAMDVTEARVRAAEEEDGS